MTLLETWNFSRSEPETVKLAEHSPLHELQEIAHTFPKIANIFQALHEHHPYSAFHTMTVACVVIQSARTLRLPLDIAGISAISHDLGKLTISADLLTKANPTEKECEAMREPHMEALRRIYDELIASTPTIESKKKLELSRKIAMSTHEILGSIDGKKVYPRQLNHEALTTPPYERDLKVLLALADVTDRIAHGFYGEKDIDAHSVRNTLHDTISHKDSPLNRRERYLLADTVLDYTARTSHEDISEAMRIFNIHIPAFQ